MFGQYEIYIKPAILILDILAVAYIFYRVYSLLSRTRAIQLLIGFGVILVVDVVADKFELTTLSWLITNVSSYLVIGLIVLLQPELRRIIAEMGRMPIFQMFSPPAEVPIGEIITAVTEMAKGKVGSLIVILREIRPQSIIENSVQINSKITPELLETIFFKDSPLHDGAVIIEGGQIVAASCYLPLSNSRQIKKTYGSRHRAGLGYSEESDAIIVVTSEETGRITLMNNGIMRTPIPPGHLAFELKELLHSKTIKESVGFLNFFKPTERTNKKTDD